MEASFLEGLIGFYLLVVCVLILKQKFTLKIICGMECLNKMIGFKITKRVGELMGEAYQLEYGWDAVRIVRPSNVYGPYDDFNPTTTQVIPALINRMVNGENPVKVWGDGSAIRDFIYSEDVAYWIIKAVENAPPCMPINLGNSNGITIKVTETIASLINPSPEIIWDIEKPSGDPIRILSMDRAKEVRVIIKEPL